jgi:alpha-L-fucosidase
MNVDKHVDPSINAMIRRLQPNAVINNRGFDDGDFGTPERDYDTTGEELLTFAQRTEACQSVGSESWGYRRNEDYYTDRHLIRSIDKYLARDANYLLNVGPAPDGTIPARPAAILRRIGKWYAAVKESFESTVPASNLTTNRSVLLTRRDNTLYVHLNKDAVREAVQLKPIEVMPRRAMLLNSGAPAECLVEMAPSDHIEHKPYLHIRNLPVDEMANTVLIVKLEFEKLPA